MLELQHNFSLALRIGGFGIGHIGLEYPQYRLVGRHLTKRPLRKMHNFFHKVKTIKHSFICRQDS